MLRVRSEKLLYKNAKYYLEDKLYSGIIFFLENSILVNKKISQDGVIVDDYHSQFIKSNEFNLEVEDKLLFSSDYGEMFFNDEPFTGIGHEFYDRRHTEETNYRNGYAVNMKLGTDDSDLFSIFYDESGEIYNFERDTGKYHYDYALDEESFFRFYFSHYLSGKPDKFGCLKKEVKYYLDVKFEEEEELTSLAIKGDYFNEIIKLKKIDIELFERFKTKDFLKELTIDTGLSLFHEGITDEIFFILLGKQNLNKLQHLRIADTSLTDTSFKKLIGLKELQLLSIASTTCSLDVILEIKKQNLNCEVIFNDEEIIS